MAIYFLNEESKKILEESNKLLYKIMPVDRVLEFLEKGRWAFVSPTLWQDPFERAFLEANYKHKGKLFTLPVKPSLINEKLYYNLFASCFTETKESEAFWKTYSPNGDGIRVAINASTLISKLSSLKDYDVYIGKALYQNYETLYKFKTDKTYWMNLESTTVNKTHLELLLKKRIPFEYENEIRVLLLRKKRMKNSIAKVTIPDFKNLIVGIKLDPRMGLYMSKFVKEIFHKNFDRKLIKKSTLYSKPKSTIFFDNELSLPTSDIPKTYELW